MIDEPALRRPIGGPQVMREQLLYLRDMAHPQFKDPEGPVLGLSRRAFMRLAGGAASAATALRTRARLSRNREGRAFVVSGAGGFSRVVGQLSAECQFTKRAGWSSGGRIVLRELSGRDKTSGPAGFESGRRG
ncbi:Scr1 family TA system antitoxin-like transcriptional regulator [Actinocorallia aurea]